MQTDWELSKENFQPLKRGRKEVNKPVGVGENRSHIERQRRQALHAKRRKHCNFSSTSHCVCRAFWQELDLYDGDDPLEIWIRYTNSLRKHHTRLVNRLLHVILCGTRLQVHQVDPGHLSQWWSPGRAATAVRALYAGAAGLRAVQERCSIPPYLDPVCKRSWTGRCNSGAKCESVLRPLATQADALPEPRDVFRFLKVSSTLHVQLYCQSWSARKILFAYRRTVLDKTLLYITWHMPLTWSSEEALQQLMGSIRKVCQGPPLSHETSDSRPITSVLA